MEDKKPVGRPTKYKPKDAKNLGENLVYALVNDENEIFYIGSTKKPKNRFQSYIRLNAHNNNRLLSNLKAPWWVMPLYNGDDFRLVEIKKINEHRPKCNFSVLCYNNKKYGFFWKYVKKYTNMFGSNEFIQEIKTKFKKSSEEEKEIINKNFKELFTRAA